MTQFFRSKPRVVKAVQWFPPEVKPELYPQPDNRPGFEDVNLIGSDHANIILGTGKLYLLQAGDWIINTGDTRFGSGYEVYSDREFKILFESI